ncbi:hypothetical protein KKC88_02265 [Patescibacteria group bacterium]|nr:hypothetical protein [Patescibacteria group bacterium]MBU1673132.1 hypothetical protein [Patescibacteria group bacterium]MBU1963810.1 hypothetical protein [Patescibacteria group bacterium]
MKKILIFSTILMLFFSLGCTKNGVETTVEEQVQEAHVMVVTSTPSDVFNEDKYKEYIDKLVVYSQEPNNKVDNIYFTGQYAPRMMSDFQSKIDLGVFPENIKIYPIPDSLDINAQIKDFQSQVEENGINVYKLTIFGETYSEDEALATANALYNDYISEEDRQKMKEFLEERKDADFETLKTDLHVLEKRDFAINFFAETPEVSFREYNLLISEDEKVEIIKDFFLNMIDYLQNY